MSDIYESTDTEAVAAATAETILQLVSPASLRPSIEELRVSFSNPASSDGPALVELVRQTSAGTSAAGPTPRPTDPAAPASLCSTLKDFTVEPTDGGVVVYKTYLPVQATLEKVFDKDEIRLAISDRLGLRITAPQAQTVCASLKHRD